MDKNQNGVIEFSEFLRMMAHRQSLSNEHEEELTMAFRVFDKDQDGFITREELKELMERLGEDLADQDIDEMIAAADSDGDGKVNYEEFVRVLTGK